MRKTIIVISVAIALIIRLILATQSGLSYDGYETLLQVQHIADTGLPLYSNELEWGGSAFRFMPLFYYILALITIFLPVNMTVFLIPNILFSLLPIPVYLLARELTKRRGTAEVVTIASAFTPLLYLTTNNASPISLALPLLLFTFYLFIRLGKTPKDQNQFIIVLFALLLTYPIGLLLIPAMAITLLLTYIQKTRFQMAQVEATIFTTFLLVWGYILVYKNTLSAYGLKALVVGTVVPPLNIATIATLVGIIPLFAGVYAAFNFLTKEKNEAAHAIIAFALAIIFAMLFQALSFIIGIVLLGTLLIILSAGAIDLYIQARQRSKVPIIYRLMYAFLLIIFLLTNVIPAITYGITVLDDAPTDTEQETLQHVQRLIPQGKTLFWNQRIGFFLQTQGYAVPYTENIIAHPDGREITADLQGLTQISSQIQFIEVLNKHDIDYLVLPQNHNYPISERCFQILRFTPMEIYRLECVVQ